VCFYVDGFTSMSGCVFLFYPVLNRWFFHILCKGVFSLWLVMSNVIVDVGLCVANHKSWTTSQWLNEWIWMHVSQVWMVLSAIVRQVDP
jgi:hypothetical protein